jgi:RNA polymerase sigma-70 factor (ECF subfamily)
LTREDEDRLAGLLRRAIGGDEAAYAEFLRRAASFARAVARKKLGSGSDLDPEDIVQETLLAIHLKRHTWRSDEPVLPWLAAIARHKAIDGFRRRGRHVEVDIDDYAEIIAAPTEETASERDIRRALGALSAGQRSVVSSIALEGHSISETAANLGMKETAVRVALHRGLSAIAAKFGSKA